MSSFIRNPLITRFFKVFGSLGFASTLPVARYKFQERARMCILLGYHPGMKGYMMYDVQKSLCITRHVDEKTFPFHLCDASDSLVDSFYDRMIPKPASELISLLDENPLP